MKYVIFSFDDGRRDFYTNVLPILKKYTQVATVNVIGSFIGRHAPNGFLSSNNEFMTLEEIQTAYNYGIEIGNHSMNHTNDIQSVLAFSIGDYKIDGGGYGFASPSSEICKRNIELYLRIKAQGKLLYIRSGRQIRRDGAFHAILYILLKRLRSPYLFRLYQKRNVIDLKKDYLFYPSCAIDFYSTAQQMKYVISKLKDEQAVIFMFHSILKKSDIGYGKDKWFNDAEMFEDVCRFCAEDKTVKVVTNLMLSEIHNGGRA